MAVLDGLTKAAQQNPALGGMDSVCTFSETIYGVPRENVVGSNMKSMISRLFFYNMGTALGIVTGGEAYRMASATRPC